MDRPEEFRYDLGYGTVQAVHPKSWEVDILAEDGGLVQRAIVLTARLPEPSTPERPQWVVFGFASHIQGRPLCWPIPSRLTGPRLPRDELVWYDEVGPYRLSINTADEFEIRNTAGDALHRIRIQQQDGVVRLDTPRTRIVLKEYDQSVTIECDKAVNVSCETARVEATERAEVVAPDVRLGDPAGQQIPLGNALLGWLQAFAGLYNAHLHPHGEPTVGQTDAQVLPPTSALLSDVSKTQ